MLKNLSKTGENGIPQILRDQSVPFLVKIRTQEPVYKTGKIFLSDLLIISIKPVYKWQKAYTTPFG